MAKAPTPLNRMLSESAGLAEELFFQRYTDPYLLVEPIHGDEDDERAFQTVLIRNPDIETTDENGEDREAQMFPVVKEGVENANLITIGRAGTSDIRLDNPAISKLHAYFSRDPITGAIALSDAGSTNGTVVGGQALRKDRPVELKGGEVIKLADRFRAVYLPPKRLYDHLMDLRRRR